VIENLYNPNWDGGRDQNPKNWRERNGAPRRCDIRRRNQIGVRYLCSILHMCPPAQKQNKLPIGSPEFFTKFSKKYRQQNRRKS